MNEKTLFIEPAKTARMAFAILVSGKNFAIVS